MIEKLPLTLFYKILLYVEDRQEVPTKDFAKFGSSRQAIGALGRLEGLGLITRSKNKEGDTVTLTEKGDELIATLLNNVATSDTKWDGMWHIIMFDIPESNRTARQAIRIKLLDMGARMLQSSVWITPRQTVVNEFQKFIENKVYVQNVHIFSGTYADIKNLDIRQMWKLDTLANDYTELFSDLQSNLKKIKGEDASFLAKCYIICLSLLAKRDPMLPTELMPKNWPGKKIQTYYTQLREFCN